MSPNDSDIESEAMQSNLSLARNDDPEQGEDGRREPTLFRREMESVRDWVADIWSLFWDGGTEQADARRRRRDREDELDRNR
jgi:hypothetical protein